jgi:hypothetical protein
MAGEDRGSPGSFTSFVSMVISAEILFAVLVRLVLGTPPAGATTVVFGLLMAIGLGLQQRSSAVDLVARRDRRGGPPGMRR